MWFRHVAFGDFPAFSAFLPHAHARHPDLALCFGGIDQTDEGLRVPGIQHMSSVNGTRLASCTASSPCISFRLTKQMLRLLRIIVHRTSSITGDEGP